MRHRIAFENRPTTDGRVIESGALTWVDEPLPLLISMGGEGHSEAHRLGTVTDISRGTDPAELWATLSHPIRGMAPEVDLDSADWEEGPYGLMVVKRARLRAVTLGLRPCWPGLVIE